MQEDIQQTISAESVFLIIFLDLEQTANVTDANAKIMGDFY